MARMDSPTSRVIRVFPIWADLERPGVVAGQTVLVAAVVVLPLLYTLVPPLEDYPNHLARMFALASLRELTANRARIEEELLVSLTNFATFSARRLELLGEQAP